MNTSWQKFVSSWDASCEKRVLYLPPASLQAQRPFCSQACSSVLFVGQFVWPDLPCVARRPRKRV